MDEKLREKLVAGFERAVLVAGAGNYEEGIDTARKLVGKMHEYISRIRTVDELRLVLDECPPFSKLEGVTVLFLFNHLPQVVRIGLKMAAQKAASTIPALPGGRRPVIPAHRVGEVLDYVSLLHRKGCSFEAAIKRTAQKFGSSERTIERIWARRESIPDEETMSAPTMEEALAYLTTQITSKT